MTELGQLIITKTNRFFKDLEDDKNHRYHSWEYCYTEFKKARNEKVKDVDKLSLHLAFYLASWGMYRGSSFLLWKDYKVHEATVRIILDKKYDALCGIDHQELQKKDNQDLLFSLSKEIEEHYSQVKQNVNNSKNKDRKASETLVTKVLLGMLGCVPAYDRFFIRGLKENGIATHFNSESVNGLCKRYEENAKEFGKLLAALSRSSNIDYPQMKLLDMGFWQIGFDSQKKMIY